MHCDGATTYVLGLPNVQRIQRSAARCLQRHFAKDNFFVKHVLAANICPTVCTRLQGPVSAGCAPCGTVGVAAASKFPRMRLLPLTKQGRSR